ncbi:hypothetical protein VaNZ11_011946 [Volvox africanus]|uniref:Protein kinase domain-containing protein n=1 Tax=Volvox africanus TaxID=51714 RepID=A0ABQ5SE11_9CHLO|nr:hypothetical protein VaNZ11_011946 [Volvox africanus]
MVTQEDFLTKKAPEGTNSAERGAVSPCQHFQRSPTLLFDILAESDKDKQQQKLRQATISTVDQKPLSPTPPQHVQQQQQHADLQKSTALAQQIPQLLPEGSKKAVIAPATPDLPEILPAARSGEASSGAGGSGDETAPSSHNQRCDVAGAQAETGEVEEVLLPEEPPKITQQQPQCCGVVIKNATTASGAAAARPHGATAGTPCPTADTVTVGTSGIPGPPRRELLEDFTPRLILLELLGELFIPPELLVMHGTFGQGAFATVQRCGLEMLPGGPSLAVAVKTLKPHVLSDFEDLRRFLLEANLLRKLHHPNIVSIHGLGAHDLTSLESLRNSAYVVMEGLQGGDLRMMLLRQMTSHSRAYSRLDALRWCMHIAAACAYLHETCRPMVIHRDLKPENVMLTGGPVDGRVAKITDFGLHKRARYSRTEDVLIAVTNEWSTRGGSVYRGDGNGTIGIGGGGGGVYSGGSVRAGGTVRGGNSRADYSTYAGSIVDMSYYGGNTFIDTSAHWNAAASATATTQPLGGYGICGGNGSTHQGNYSTSARHVAVATAGVVAAPTEPTAQVTNITAHPAANGLEAALPHRVAPNKLVAAVAIGGNGSNDGTRCTDGFTEVTGLVSAAAAAAALADAGASTCPAGSLPPGDSLRAGSEAAAELGISAAAGQHGKLTERERPYLLAFDKRYDTPLNGGSKWNSSTDLAGMNEASVAAAAAAAAAVHGPGARGAPPSPPLLPTPAGVPKAQLQSQPPQGQQPVGWTPPNVVPPASLEESVHRKLLALMALESAAMAAPSAAAAGNRTTAGAGGGGASNGGGSNGNAPATAAFPPAAAQEAPFSITEFVRAATAVLPGEAVSSMPSAVMVMRSMSLALQQQREHQQGQQGQQPQQQEQLPFVSFTSGVSVPTAMQTAAGARIATRAAAMKTVPENNRMSMDVGSPAAASHGKGGANASTVVSVASHSCASAALPASSGKRHAEGTHKREKVASAAARMADATRQVGSLVYMAPELVLSGNYNEKVDVFSFAIIAYELFTGKLLAMKIANEYAFQLEQQGGSAAARGARAGPGGLPDGTTRSAEQDAEAGVMAYVMRRCSGTREPLPSWWPSELQGLIARCWAQDPADRPSFSQIHRELRRMQHTGVLVDMDTRDPLRSGGCLCTIS